MKSKIVRLLLVFCFLPLFASGEVFKIATISPDGLGWMSKFRVGLERIEAETNKRVTFKIYPGGVQGDDATVLRKMRIRQLNGGVFAAGSLTRFFPDLQVYNLPLQFRSYEEVDFVRARMDSYISDGLQKAGIKTFAFTETGFAYLLANEPVSSLADLRKLKAWIPDNDPIAAELIKSFDVSPIPLNITDVLPALQTGMINAVVGPPSVILALQWHNHLTHLMNLPLVYIYSMLAMDMKVYSKASSTDQDTVVKILDEVFELVGRETRSDNERALQALKKIGITFVEPTDKAEWQTAADLSVQKLMRSGEISGEVVNTYLELLKNFRSIESN
ncbi:MAG: TRAP transporter substrate-binding protein DctP [Pseudomonadota bacterium]|nr:TRAP transporter substrate-binding protein DctP [Pseudomonadota bacterium]